MELLTFASFNIRNNRAITDGFHHWLFRRKSTAKAIRSLHAEIVGLQEVRPRQLRFLQEYLPEYRFFSQPRSGDSGEHCPILVRDWRVEHSEVRWFSKTPRVKGSRFPGMRDPRIATILYITRDNHTLAIANVHLDPVHQEAQYASLELLAKWAQQCTVPLILLGDFNLTLDDPGMQALLKEGFRDALGHLPTFGFGAASHHSFRGNRYGTRIDHILVPNTWEVQHSGIFQATVDGKLPSDHWPIVATVRLP